MQISCCWYFACPGTLSAPWTWKQHTTCINQHAQRKSDNTLHSSGKGSSRSLQSWGIKSLFITQMILTISSVASGQSRSPSQRHLLVMQYPFPHAKSFSGLHLFSGHFLSSLPSPQSSSRSQSHFFLMQLPLSQENSSGVQVWSGKERQLHR